MLAVGESVSVVGGVGGGGKRKKQSDLHEVGCDFSMTASEIVLS